MQADSFGVLVSDAATQKIENSDLEIFENISYDCLPGLPFLEGLTINFFGLFLLPVISED